MLYVHEINKMNKSYSEVNENKKSLESIKSDGEVNTLLENNTKSVSHKKSISYIFLNAYNSIIIIIILNTRPQSFFFFYLSFR